MASTRLLTWGRVRLLAGVSGAQTAVQVLAFAAGLVIVRNLHPDQYALYTLAMACIGAAAVLTELGLSQAVLAQAGRLGASGADAQAHAGADPACRPEAAAPDMAVTVAVILSRAERLQIRLAWAALPLVALGCLGLMLRLQASWPEALALTVLVGLVALWQVRVSLRLVALRAQRQVLATQGVDLALQAARALLLLALAGLASLNAAIALGVAWLAAWLGAALLRARVLGLCGALGRQVASLAAQQSQRHDPALLAHARRQAPNSLYYLVSGPVAVWLVGCFGSAESVAGVGALGRLAALWVLVGAVATAVVQPWFARTQEPRALRAAFGVVNAALAAVLLLLLTVTLTAPQSLLWVLGSAYGGLDAELFWLVLGGGFGAWGGVVYHLGCARGWVMPLSRNAPYGLAVAFALALVVDVGSAQGALTVAAGMSAAGLLATLHYVWRQLLIFGSAAASPGPAAPMALPGGEEARAGDAGPGR